METLKQFVALRLVYTIFAFMFINLKLHTKPLQLVE